MKIEIITKDELEELTKKVEHLIQVVTQKKESPSEYYSNDELCEVLKVSKRTLQNYRDRSMIEFVQVGRKIYYPAAAIEKFMEGRTISFSNLKNFK